MPHMLHEGRANQKIMYKNLAEAGSGTKKLRLVGWN